MLQFSSTYLATTARKLELVEYYYKMVPEGHLTWEEWAFFNLHILLILAYAGAAWQFLSNKQLFNRAILKFIWLFKVDFYGVVRL